MPTNKPETRWALAKYLIAFFLVMGILVALQLALQPDNSDDWMDHDSPIQAPVEGG